MVIQGTLVIVVIQDIQDILEQAYQASLGIVQVQALVDTLVLQVSLVILDIVGTQVFLVIQEQD